MAQRPNTSHDYSGKEHDSGSSSSNRAPLHVGWERYTKGVGSKLLQKMGYIPGQGLGRDNEGIFEPIKLQANKGREMLGMETEEREHRRRERITKSSKHKGLRYDSDDDENNQDSSEDETRGLPKFVQDDKKQDEDQKSEIDEDSPQYIAKQLIASNEALIMRLKDEYKAERGKRGLLEQAMESKYETSESIRVVGGYLLMLCV